MTTDFAGDDIAADIRAAMNETPAPEPAAEAPAPEPTEAAPAAETPPAEPPAETPEQQRARDEQGRFAKAAEKVQAAPQSPAAPEPPPETIRPPVSWSATAKAEFAKLPPLIQQEVLKREKDIENGKAQWDQKGERLNRFDALIAPHRDRLQLAQQDEFAYVQALIRADEMLRTNPHQALPQIAALYGIHLGQPPGQAQQPMPQGQAQAQPVGLTQEQVQVQAREIARAELQSYLEQQALADAARQWEQFRSDPAHPYADNVLKPMEKLIRSGQADTFAEAYEQACWANPEIRSLLIAAQRSAPKPTTSVPAGLSVTGARGTANHQTARSNGLSGSIEDDIRAAMVEVSGRA